ncbi:MAG: YqhA family protein [Mariprofundaceae bacterium]
MKDLFEKMLWASRYLTLLAVISSLIGMSLLFVLSAIDMFHLLHEFINVFVFGQESPNFHTVVVSHVITAVDDFLLAMVLLIFALGVYELFIDKIEFLEAHPSAGKILQVESLDDLKNTLGKVILMILIVAFFKTVLHVEFTESLDVLYMGGGILMVALAGYFGHKSDH